VKRSPHAIDPQPWNIGEALGVGWIAFRAHPLRLAVGSLLVLFPLLTVIPALVFGVSNLLKFMTLTGAMPLAQAPSLGALVAATRRMSADPAAKTTIALLYYGLGGAALFAIASPMLAAGTLAFFTRAAHGETPRWRDLARGVRPGRALALIVLAPAGLLAALLVLSLVGWPFFLLGLPLAGVALAPFYVVDASVGPIEAIAASWRATSGARFQLWIYMLGFLPAVVVGLIAGGVGIFVTLPVYGIGFAYACTRLSARTTRPLFSPDWGSRYLRASLRIAFIALLAAFGVACFFILHQAPHLRAGWSLGDAAIRVAAVLLGVGLVLTLHAAVLPAILDLLEGRGFSSFVGARHVRSQKSGFLTIISVLSICGVAVSSCSLSSVSSIMGGFSTDLKRKILGNNAHIVIDTESRAPWSNWDEVVERARLVPGIVGATPVVQGEVMVQSASNLAGVIVRGVDPETIGNVIDLKQNIEVGKFEYLSDPDKLRRLPPDEIIGIGKSGERFMKGKDILPLPDDLDPAVREAIAVRPLYPGVVIGRELAKTLHVYVGEEVTLVSPLGDLGPMGVLPRMKKFRVAAVFYSGMYEYDASHVYIELGVAQEYFELGDKVHFVDLRTDNVQNTDAITPLVRQAVARPELRVRDWREMNRNLFSALKLERFAMFLILSIAIMVASFCIVCTLLLMVTEKGKEIAILKAMGASDGAILRTFMGEGVIIGTIGTAFGVTMSLALCLGLKWFGLPLNPEVYYIDRLPINVDPVDFCMVTLAALTICTISTIYPAHAASRLRPVDGLRYE
jgi:lipoprotein-releasing system permease protein